MQIQLGIDVFLTQAKTWQHQRIAMVTNDAATTSTGILSRKALLQQGFSLTKLFAPEHGIYRTGDDGVAQQNSIDAVTQLPVISLYGDKLSPTAADMANTDLVVFDVPDAGCRFYTYLWTMTYVMEACAQCGVPFLVLDRPNPIGANLALAEGPFLDEAHCASFIGRWNIPLKHGCTLGELALYFAATKIKNIQVNVIKCENYQRNDRAGLQFPFVPTSPALQHIASALLYPGMCLLEGINVNEGRGTSTPFTLCGAPWINKEELLKHWVLKNIPGVSVSTCSYTPQIGIYAGELCHGVQFTVSNMSLLQPVAMGIALLQTLLHCYPHHVTQRLYPTAANPSGGAHLDKLLGIPHAFSVLKTQQPISTAVNPLWQNTIKDYLLYPEAGASGRQ